MSTRLRALPLLAAAVLACGEPPTPPTPSEIAGVDGMSAVSAGSTTYILNATGQNLPANLAASVAAAGGTLTSAFDEAGVAVAESDNPSFAANAAKIKGIGEVGPDMTLQFTKPSQSNDSFDDQDVDAAFVPGGVFGATET